MENPSPNGWLLQRYADLNYFVTIFANCAIVWFLSGLEPMIRMVYGVKWNLFAVLIGKILPSSLFREDSKSVPELCYCLKQ